MNIVSCEIENLKIEIEEKQRAFSESDPNETGGYLVCPAGYAFLRHRAPIDEARIEELLGQADVVIPYTGKVSSEKTADDTVRDLFVRIAGDPHRKEGIEDWICTMEKLLEGRSETESGAFQKVLSSNLIMPGGAILLRPEAADAYAGWLGEILPDLFQMSDGETVSAPGNNSARIGSLKPDVKELLIAILTRTWLLSNSYKVREENYGPIPAEQIRKGEEKIDLLKRYMSLKLQELVMLRKEQGFSESLIMPVSCEDDFEGKIPVWVCWWQGLEEELPLLVKACLESLRRALPPEKVTLRIITLENCGQYVTFSDAVIEKFNQGKISYTHLSDCLRAELLYRYGGMWIDATCFVSGDLPAELFDEELFTVAFEKPLWPLDVMKGRWSTFLWICKAGNPLFQFITEGLWIYWETEDKPVDYFFLDYIIETAVENFPELEEQILRSRKSPAAVYDLQLRMNQRMTAREESRIREDSVIYKLNRRLSYVSDNGYGYETVYGWILRTIGGETAYSGETKLYAGADAKDVNNGTTAIRRKVSSPKEYFELVRAMNPDKVLDRNGMLAKWGYVSRMTIDETGVFGMQIDTCEGNDLCPVHSCVYDHILPIEQVREADYDLILE